MRTRVLKYFVGLLILCVWTSCTKDSVFWHNGYYQGEMLDGYPEGYGQYVSVSGDKQYQGTWKKGVPDGYGLYLHGDTCYQGAFRKGFPDGQGFLRVAGKQVYEGSFKRGRKDGEGVMVLLTTSQRFYGIWRSDTLPSGCRTDSIGIYRGSFNALFQASGNGVFQEPAGKRYYEGNWTGDKRDGFGMEIAYDSPLKCGVWRKNRFRGERMRYTTNRVYGIDISRHQHEKGRKRYGISWRNLRIRHLSESNNVNVVGGKVNFPVSFCYIKSTQGIRIVNRYYANDRKQARAVGIHVGAYHFMSTASGQAQARHFFRNTPIGIGDLPPMLDVELTPRQIQQMGGLQAMFREMLSWLRIVETRTGTRPLLYVGQSFVNDYLPHAPKELLDYDVWIARYGEFKPFVHLLYWQLSPYGRVSGIHGDVDINVFSGSKEQFLHYVQEHGVKRLP